jgi:hypothetical protein
MAQTVERNGSIEVAYRLDRRATGSGAFDVEWTDALRRVVERRRIPLTLVNAAEVVFSIDTRRAVAIKNTLRAHLSLDFTDENGAVQHRDATETANFIAAPADRPWSDFPIMIWHEQTAAGYAALKRRGTTGGMVESDNRSESGTYMHDQLERLLDANLRFYVENIATDFYSPYHKFAGDRPPNWRFTELRARHHNNPLDPTAFIREPSLSDPAWLNRIRDRIARDVQALRPYQPLYYSLADEAGIADLSAFWDFDLSTHSLHAMRDWLKESYGSIEALNREWASNFAGWADVVPMMTQDALKRTDQNFSAWADFKTWMDVAFARAVQAGTDAVHAADADAIAAIEGGQIPGWGGYDYSRLVEAVDAIELYHYGDNIEIARSLNPRLLLLATSSGSGVSEKHRVWRLLLRGIRGLVLWDPNHDLVGTDGALGRRGREAGYLGEIGDGIGALLVNSRRHVDPIAILYSPPSMRVQWLLDRNATGEDWTRRNASAEYGDDAIRKSTRNFARAIEHMGFQHRFVSARQLKDGELRNRAYRVLILPRTIALSHREADEIRDFVAAGGVVLADGEPGGFDEHGRKLGKPLLGDLFATVAGPSAGDSVLGRGRAILLAAPDPGYRESVQSLREIIDASGLRPRFSLTLADGRRDNDIESYVFDNGDATILALQQDFRESSWLNRAGPEEVAIALPHRSNVYDLRQQQKLGATDRVVVKLDPAEPTILAFTKDTGSSPSITGPDNLRPGESAEFVIRPGQWSGAAIEVIRFEVVDPDAEVVSYYSDKLLVANGVAVKHLPFAVNDKSGVWTLRATELLSGKTAATTLNLHR